ncbi:MAG: FtsW/RodA/SpoVE family cell cycle protein [Planctomycetes bacterium]|nr:FtsW/RodA/SpoVE family cell cycle protein [Planctomycetota bacterium]MCB9918403.1 FtsW/RodA/SpoVE family cell cycle protein [Planctomycetota bacterium]
MRLEVESRIARFAGVFVGFPWYVFVLAFVLAGVGFVFVHSATIGSDDFAGQDSKQAMAIVVCGAIAIGLSFVPRAFALSNAFVLFALVLTALALLPWFGVTLNGARRWYGIGSATIQPTEFAKPILVLALARWLRLKSHGGFVDVVLIPLILTLLPMYLTLRQPDLGSALSMLPILFAMSWVAGARPLHLFATIALGALGLVAVLPFLQSYQLERIAIWLGQDHLTPAEWRGPGYQLMQSLIAIGSGGVSGDGLFEGLQNRYDFLPYRSTDFLFAVICEETGFRGAMTVILLYTFFSLSIVACAYRLRDRFGRLLAAGVATYFAAHLFIHVGVCTGLLPPTGLPLPLLSYGRSSVASAWFALALVGHAATAKPRDLSEDAIR